MVGGVSGLVATIMLKPRVGRFDKNVERPQMANPANALIGMFMLWYDRIWYWYYGGFAEMQIATRR